MFRKNYRAYFISRFRLFVMPTPEKYDEKKVDREESTSKSHKVSIKNEFTDSSRGSGNSHCVNTNLGPQISAQNANIVMHNYSAIATAQNHAVKAISSTKASTINGSGSSSTKVVSRKKPVRLRKNISLQKAEDELGPIVRSK